MGIMIKSTKAFYNLPCAHSQWFDTEQDGSPGECAGIHGYDRMVRFTFAGEVDEYGWIYPFGDLAPVKKFLEYYFDHTTALGADDPRLDQITDEMLNAGGLLHTLRILPSGVSMEMSCLFVWEYVNPYIYHTTGGRVFVEKIEIKEHARNSGMIEVDRITATKQAQQYKSTGPFMVETPCHEYEPPHEAIKRIGMI